MVFSKIESKADYQRIFLQGRKLFLPGLKFYFLTGQPKTRVAVIVSKKVAARAIRRNLFKRRIKGALLAAKDALEQLKISLLIVAQPAISEQDYETIKKEIDTFLQKNRA